MFMGFLIYMFTFVADFIKNEQNSFTSSSYSYLFSGELKML